MNLKAQTEIRESFIHLTELKTFINLKHIEQLDYCAEDDEGTEMVMIYMNNREEVITVSHPEDIKTIGFYFPNRYSQ